jgi:hypothetical protein
VPPLLTLYSVQFWANKVTGMMTAFSGGS